jgi:hypothetical protein
MASRSEVTPSVVEYWRADLAWSRRTRREASSTSAMGKVPGLGRPPAKLMMFGRSVSFRSSRISLAFWAWVRAE